MRGMFDLNSPLMRGLSKFADLVMLNLLTILCSIPIVTLGAASTALYYSVGRMHRNEGLVSKDFFHAFKENFKQATLLWLVFLVTGAVLILAVLFYGNNDLPGRQIFFIISILVLMVWAFCLSWVFPLQSRFVTSFRGTLVNSMICAVGFLPRTLLITVVNAIPIFVFLCLPELFLWAGFAWIAFWFSAAAYLNIWILQKPFDTLISQIPAQEE